MKEDVIAANLANLRQSVNELKESVDKLSNNSSQQVRSAVSPIDERTVYNSVAKSFCNCWNDALSILKKSVRKEQPDKIPFSLHIPADTRSAFPVISVHSPVSIQCRWQS